MTSSATEEQLAAEHFTWATLPSRARFSIPDHSRNASACGGYRQGAQKSRLAHRAARSMEQVARPVKTTPLQTPPYKQCDAHGRAHRRNRLLRARWLCRPHSERHSACIVAATAAANHHGTARRFGALRRPRNGPPPVDYLGRPYKKTSKLGVASCHSPGVALRGGPVNGNEATRERHVRSHGHASNVSKIDGC